MRRIAPLWLALAAAFMAPSALAADIEVTLSGIRTAEGTVGLALVQADGWDGKAPRVQGTGGPATAGSATFVFRDVAPGRYAVMVSHDENGNGRLDTNLIGMPVEGYGFSNNPRVMRKPTFDEAAFEVGQGDVALVIELR